MNEYKEDKEKLKTDIIKLIDEFNKKYNVRVDDIFIDYFNRNLGGGYDKIILKIGTEL